MTRHHARSGVRARAGWWLWVHAWKLVGLLAVAAIMVAVWPVTVTAVAGYLAAWLSGQPPARLWLAAAWSVPMTGVWLLAHAMASGTWQGVALAPVRDWRASWHQAAAAHIPAAFAVTAPAAIPLGLAAAAIGWGWRNYAIASGLAGFTASAPIIFDARQWRRQARTAQARIAAPGAVPLLDSRGRIPVGGTIRTIGHRWQPVLRIPAALLGRHSVIVGATGTGKTSLMMRLWAGWYAATRRASTAAGRC